MPSFNLRPLYERLYQIGERIMNVYEMYLEMNKRKKNVRCIERATGNVYKRVEDLPILLAESPEYFVMFKPEVKYSEVLK